MGFLDKLWDETLAGPTPDSGLGKLRKYNSFSAARSSAAQSPGVVAAPHDDSLVIPVSSRNTTVLRSNAHRSLTVSVDSPPVPASPCSSTTPTPPFSPSTPRGNFKKISRTKSSPPASQSPASKAPTGYDWIVLSALDRC